MKKIKHGYLKDNTFYSIRENVNYYEFVINGRIWHTGSLESIKRYIETLNNTAI